MLEDAPEQRGDVEPVESQLAGRFAQASEHRLLARGIAQEVRTGRLPARGLLDQPLALRQGGENPPVGPVERVAQPVEAGPAAGRGGAVAAAAVFDPPARRFNRLSSALDSPKTRPARCGARSGPGRCSEEVELT
jgi:hypothetical protein